MSSVVNDQGTNVVGETPDDCIQVSLLPGGFSALTGIGISGAEASGALTSNIDGLIDSLLGLGDIGNDTPLVGLPIIGPVLGNVLGGLTMTVSDIVDGSTDLVDRLLGELVEGIVRVNGDPINTGQILLRFPNLTNEDGSDGGAQSGYIVPHCEGTLNGQTYEYEPCFAASLNLVASAPDAQGLSLEQQAIQLNLVGPLTFQQNGRLVIALNNANTFSLKARALDLLPADADVMPGRLNFQLTGNEIHGGRAFPER